MHAEGDPHVLPPRFDFWATPRRALCPDYSLMRTWLENPTLSYRLPRRAFLFSLSKSAISETAASLGSTPQAQQIQ